MAKFSLFGFQIGKTPESEQVLPSFAPPVLDDGAVTITAAAHYGTSMNLESNYTNDVELITRYREMAMQPEIESGIDDIINEAIIQDENKAVEIVLDNLKVSPKVKIAIEEEFKNILTLLNFKNLGQDIFRRFYVDGRLNYNIILDRDNPGSGIQELRYIDPRRLSKIREVKKTKDQATGFSIVTGYNDYYIYSDNVSTKSNLTQSGLKIAPDSIINVTSGLLDAKRSIILSYLHKCITGDGKIKTPAGWTYMKNVMVGDIIYSYNIEKNSLEETKVTNKWDNGSKEILNIEWENNSFKCTPDHLILVFTNNPKLNSILEYIEAKDLVIGYHKLIVPKGNTTEFKDIISITKLKDTEEVFDIEVENLWHNFIVNDTVVHNCIKPLNQLRMIEDATIIYKVCLAGDTRVKTISGWKYIKDITEDDRIYSFYGASGVQETKVTKQWLSDTKQTYKVSSKYHDITGSDNHPILVFDKDSNIVEYVDIKDLVPKKHSFVRPTIEDRGINVKFPEVRDRSIKLLNNDIWVDYYTTKNKDKILEDLSIKFDLKYTSVRNFLYGQQYLNKNNAIQILEYLKIEAEYSEKYEYTNLDTIYNVPEYINEEFAMLFGFFLGDGVLSNKGLTFAEGTDNIQNEFYANILIKYFGNCIRFNSTRKYTNYTTSNVLANELFSKLEFSNGAKTKGFPSWIYSCDNNIKKALILGLADADGYITYNELTDSWAATIELANKGLVEDVKELWTSLGYCSSKIYHRIRGENTRIIGDELTPRTMPESESWSIRITNKLLPKFDPILEIKEDIIQDVYELEVASEKHNFIANGIVVHNSRAPERRIFYIDVGSLSKIKAEQYLKDIMAKYKNKVVYDACLDMNTLVPLLDGRTLSLTEITKEFNEGKTLWTYSCHPETGEFAPGLITNAGITRKNAKVIKITLDNNKSIICTPDHQFPVWNKGFVEAQDLIVNESMIPFYTKESKLGKNKKSIYPKIFENKTKKWLFTHRLVSQWKDKNKLENTYLFAEEFEYERKNSIHHIDHDRFNAAPENLTKMFWKDHIEYHNFNDEEDGFFEVYKNHKIVSIEYLEETMDTGTLGIDNNELYHNYHTFALDAGIYTKNSSGTIRNDRNYLSFQDDFWLPRRSDSKTTEITTLPSSAAFDDMSMVEYFEKKLYKSLNVPYSRLHQPDTGFSVGRSQEISRDEVKFAKYICRLQAKFVDLFDQALRVQCILKGVCTDDEWEDYKQNVNYKFEKDNNYEELKEAELIQNRVALLGVIDPYTGKYYSQQWIQRNVLCMSDDDIKEVKDEIEQEVKEGLYPDPKLLANPDLGMPPMPDSSEQDQQPQQDQAPPEDAPVDNKQLPNNPYYNAK